MLPHSDQPKCSPNRIQELSKLYKLTPHEYEVFLGVIRGMSNEEIGDYIHVAEKTVKFHISAIYRKMQVISRSELQAEVLRLYVDLEEL